MPTNIQPQEEAACNLDSGVLSMVELYLMPYFLLAVLIVGLPLNLLSLWVFFHRLQRWTRSTVFLFNLTLADTSWLLVTSPFFISYHLDMDWKLGWALCVGVRMACHNYFYLSIFFVTCVSVDRYVAIVHPLRSLTLLDRRQTSLLCVVVWVGALLLSIPVATMTLIQTCPGSNRTICTLYVLQSDTSKSLPFSLVCSTIGFLLPLMSICYCGLHTVRKLRNRPSRADPRNKQRRLRRVLSAVLVLFTLFYLPYHLSRNTAIAIRAIYPNNPSSWEHADLAYVLEMCLCGLVTCLNPLFSCFTGGQFRKELTGTFAAMLSRCSGTQVESLISKQTRITVRARQGRCSVTPVCVVPAPTGPMS